MDGLLFISHQTDRYDYLQSIEIALQGGCRQIQLRMKDVELSEIERTGHEAKLLCAEYGASLYINDHVEICKRVGADGVHLGRQDMSPSQAREILGTGFIIGATANTFEDIQSLVAQQVDYIGLGPFRFTTTKKNLSPVLGLDGYRKIIQQCGLNNIDLPIFAIGGITIDDITEIKETGVSGIALSSTILNAEDPVEETGKIINKLMRQSI